MAKATAEFYRSANQSDTQSIIIQNKYRKRAPIRDCWQDIARDIRRRYVFCGYMSSIELGFDQRVRGDHHIFAQEQVEEILNLQPRGSKAEERYRAVITRSGDWWIGWIEEVPGVNCQEQTKEEYWRR